MDVEQEQSQDRITVLAQQIERILTHLGTPDGQLFATEQRVQALEQIVAQQQVQIQQYELTLKKQQDALAQQFQTAVKGKSPEFTMLTKFVASHTTEVINTLQKYNRQMIEEFFQYTAPPRLQQQTPRQQPLPPPQHHALATRVALLESQPKQQQPPLHLAHSLPPATNQNQIDQIQQHIQHLENQVISYINHTYSNPNQQQPLGATLKSLQADLENLKKEVTTIRTTQHKEVSQLQIYNVLHQQILNYTDTVKMTCKKELEDTVAQYTKSEDVKLTLETLSSELQSTVSLLKFDFAGALARVKEEVRTLELGLQNLDVPGQLSKFDDHLREELETNRQLIARLEYTISKLSRKVEERTFFETNALLSRISREEPELPKMPIKQEDIQPLQPQKPTSSSIADLRYNSLTKCFYTALFQDKLRAADTLSTGERLPDWDYICFTDIPTIKSDVWDIVYVPPTEKTAVLNAKYMKWNTDNEYLRDYDVVVWMDAYMIPNSRAAERLKQHLVDMWNQETMILHRQHKERKCVYDECAAVVTHRRDTPERVALVKQMLEAIHMPKNWGLFDSNILCKFHKYNKLKNVCSLIWQQLRRLSPRDQLAITPVYYAQQFVKFSTRDLLDMFQPSGKHERHPAF
jgi:hypothetical protein